MENRPYDTNLTDAAWALVEGVRGATEQKTGLRNQSSSAVGLQWDSEADAIRHVPRILAWRTHSGPGH